MLFANISTITVTECARRTHASHAALIACDGCLKYRTYKLEAAHLCFERFFSACAFVNALRHTPTLNGCLYTRCHHLALYWSRHYLHNLELKWGKNSSFTLDEEKQAFKNLTCNRLFSWGCSYSTTVSRFRITARLKYARTGFFQTMTAKSTQISLSHLSECVRQRLLHLPQTHAHYYFVT